MTTSTRKVAPTTVKQERNCKSTMIMLGLAVSVLKSLFIMARHYFDALVDVVYGLYWEGSRQVIPDLDSRHHMLTMSATRLAKDIRDGKLKAEDLMRACIHRIQIVNPIVNAMTDERFQAAIEEAKDVDRRVFAGLTEEDYRLPYLGVPFTCKESHAVRDMRHTLGLLCRRHLRAVADAECVRLLRAAGAIPVAVTNVPELNKWQETNNMLFGLTNNPYHAGRTAGGSSGGEAALMASLASPISLCSDIGGSTRMPAFYCGLFGHNPTAGVTSLKGSLLRTGEDDTMASIGFLARNVEDLAPLTKVVAGEKAHLLKLDREINIKDVKFYYVETTNDIRVSIIRPELRKVMKDVVMHLTSLVGNADGSPRPYRHDAFDHMFALWRYWMSREKEDFARMLTDGKARVNGMLEILKKSVNMSSHTLAAIMKVLDDQVLPPVDKVWAETTTQLLKKNLFETLGDDGVLLFPSAPLPAPYHYSCFLRPFNFAHWAIFNALRCPSTQVPLGLSSEGLPLGIQVVAAPYNDALCLAVAKQLEEQFGGYVPPCKTATEPKTLLVHEM